VIEEIGAGDYFKRHEDALVGLEVDSSYIYSQQADFTGDTELHNRVVHFTPKQLAVVNGVLGITHLDPFIYFLAVRIGPKRTKADLEYDKYDQDES